MKDEFENYAWIGVCPVCGQGRQMIARESHSGRLYVHCEDCESEWQSPQEARALNRASRDTFGPSTDLTRDELAEHPWSTFLEGAK
jgi:hypothetical protein